MWAMGDRETEQKTADKEAPEPVAPVAEPEANKTEFKTEGDLPGVAKGGAGAGAITASDQAFGAPKQETKTDYDLDRGIHVHWEHYKAACEAAGQSEKWKDHYVNGHTEAKGWEQPSDTRRALEWKLKKGTS